MNIYGLINQLGWIKLKDKMNIKDALLKSLQSKMPRDTESLKDMNTISSKLKTESEEFDEATGSGSAGGYSAPLFGGEMEEEKLKGGKSDNMSLLDIAKKHTNEPKSEDRIKKKLKELELQLKKGLEVEKEHTKDIEKAKEIAMDHLSENPNYYDKLKKIEATEATGSSSSGSYEGPSFLAKSQKKKDWRGASKPLYKGGKFVKIKKKCLTFPYCNQGDINALKLTELDVFENIVKKLALEYKIDEILIKKLIKEDILKNMNI
jgi:hypothetical protein